MNTLGQILLDTGCIALLLGYISIIFCGFTDGIGRGLLNLMFPFLGFGTAKRRFPVLIWLWVGGIALIVIGAFLV